MADNPYVNKVVYNTNTLIDLTADTVTPESLIEGYTAHDRSGSPINGTAVIPTKVSDLQNDVGYLVNGDVVNNLTSGNPNPVSSGGVYGALTNIKSLTVTHGTINAGTSSTIEDTQLSKRPYVIGYSVSGAYNSDCIPWSYYWSGSSFVSRVRNVGSNNASNIQVLYYYFDLS